MSISAYLRRNLLSVCVVLLMSTVSFAESLGEGLITRENSPIYLKDGSVIECKRFWWFVFTADFIQCDKGGICKEIKIGDVDIEKTFGPEIAKEYKASKSQLKDEYEKKKEKMKDNVVS